MTPDQLRVRQQWLAWKYVTRKGRPTKVPLSPHGGAGKSNDSSTWGTYCEALACFDADGIGFVLSPDDPYVAVDLDGVLSSSGALHPDAWEIVHALNGYTEFSPSGRGLHILVRGRLKRNRSTKSTPWKDELAVFQHGKFFTVTGDGRGEIREAQDELNAMIAYYFPEDERGVRPPLARCQPLSDDDSVIVGKLLADDRMGRLWAGNTSDHGGDHSAADLALCCHLSYFTGGDAARIDSLFRRSGLFRDKWTEPRGDTTYGALTIAKALRGGT